MLKRLPLMMLLTLLFFNLNVIIGGVKSQEAELPPLTEPGPYGVRLASMTFVDENRDDWELETTIWYPADKTQGTPLSAVRPLLKDGPPDMSGAPYPLIIYSHGGGGSRYELADVTAHLASHGYVVAAAQHQDIIQPSHHWVDRPLDIMLMLDELASIADGDLAGMIDTNNIGMMGYSAGANVSLQMLGLHSDPVHYENWCAEHPDLASQECTGDYNSMEVIAAYRAQLGLENLPDGRWKPFGDNRIRAVFTMAPCEFPLTTENMLAAVNTPMMILHGTHDTLCDYEGNAVRIYTHLGTEDRYLVTLVKGGHRSPVRSTQLLRHFTTGFFGHYLMGDEAYAPYLTSEGLPRHTAIEYRVLGISLVWGPYEGE